MRRHHLETFLDIGAGRVEGRPDEHANRQLQLKPGCRVRVRASLGGAGMVRTSTSATDESDTNSAMYSSYKKADSHCAIPLAM